MLNLVNSLIVKQLSMRTKNLAILYVGISIADNIGLEGGKASTIILWTLHRPYKMPGLDLTTLIFLR